MRKLVVTLVLALMVAPAAALAGDAASGSDKQNPSEFCQAERTRLGEALFKTTYGGGANAFGKCVSQRARAREENTENAAKQCKAERSDPNFAASHDGKTFEQAYADGEKAKNAFGKCVTSKSSAAAEQELKAHVNAAKECKKARSLDATAFKATYGAKANAFGKCVSAKAEAKNDSP
jgi:hypothetical protein